MPRHDSRAVIDRSENIKTIQLPIPKVDWPQPQETSVETSKLINNHIVSATGTIQQTNTPTLNQRNDVTSRTLPLKRTSPQNPEPLRNTYEKMKLGANQFVPY